MNVILFGPPGAGKGTQAVKLSENLGVVHISSGDLLRKHQAEGTDLGNEAKSYMQQGLLVPDEVIIGMIEDQISAPDAESGYVLDGFPRTLEQARALEAALARQGQRIDHVLNIQVSSQELIGRLGGRWICRDCQRPYHESNSPPREEGQCDECQGALYQREDDKSEAVEKRIQVYGDQTYPLIQYYKDKGQLREINGEGDIQVVRGLLVDALS